jgi:hypothetical protein
MKLSPPRRTRANASYRVQSVGEDLQQVLLCPFADSRRLALPPRDRNLVSNLDMACVAPELLTLLIAERLARERLNRLRGYPDDVLEAAESLLKEATQAVADDRAKHP